ncbi:MAG: sugar phosphate isomerase/epimerase [Oscillospiraceae bacterium]|nr:sugar phosphate isomerase/epimerase [Oscillospiraceae bacterium]
MDISIYAPFPGLVEKLGWEGAADETVRLGCTSVETFSDVTAEESGLLLKNTDEAKEARKILESRGLKVTCCSVFSNLYNSPREVESLKRQAEIAEALGSPFLHHTVLPWVQEDELPPFDEAMEVGLDASEEVAKHAADFGVTCLYEDQGFYVNGIEGYATFFNEMKRRCKNVGVCGDMGNSLFVDVPGEEFFKAFSKDILHVHAKDYFRKTTPEEGWRRTLGGNWISSAPMGEGIVDIDMCMKILADNGYNGAVAIEDFDIPHSVKVLQKY